MTRILNFAFNGNEVNFEENFSLTKILKYFFQNLLITFSFHYMIYIMCKLQLKYYLNNQRNNCIFHVKNCAYNTHDTVSGGTLYKHEI